jgi:hypothetical protein
MADLAGHGFPDDATRVALSYSLETRNESSGFYMVQLGASARDTTAPVIANMSPSPDVAPGSPGGFPATWAEARLTPITFDVLDEDPGIRLLVVTVAYSHPGASDAVVVAYDGAGGGLQPGWTINGAVTAIDDGWHVEILPDDGWPSGAGVAVNVRAVDSAGNLEGPAVLVAFTVSPASVSVSAASTTQLTATGFYDDSSVDDVSGSAEWTSSAPAVATVDAAGLVTGVTAGSATITGELGAFSDTAIITVTPLVLVPQDGPNNYKFPTLDSHWPLLGLPVPTEYWDFQEASGAPVGKRGIMTALSLGGTPPTYQAAIAGYTRKGYAFPEASNCNLRLTIGQGPNPASTSVAWLLYFQLQSATGARNFIAPTGGSGGSCVARTNTTPRVSVVTTFGSSALGTNDPSAMGVAPYLITINYAVNRTVLYTPQEMLVGPGGAYVDGTKGFGAIGATMPQGIMTYGAHWSGADAELIDDKATLTALGVTLPY